MGKITVEVKINTFGTMTHPTLASCYFEKGRKLENDNKPQTSHALFVSFTKNVN